MIRWGSSGLGVTRWVSSGLGVIRWMLLNQTFEICQCYSISKLQGVFPGPGDDLSDLASALDSRTHTSPLWNPHTTLRVSY